MRSPVISIAAGLIAVLFLLLVPTLASLAGQPYLIGFGSRVLIYALAAVSLDLILGFGGMVSFGHAAFFGLGGYVVGILFFHAAEDTPLLGFIPGTQDALPAWGAAILVSALAGLAIGALSLRTSGVHFIMITLAFAQMLYFIFAALKKYGGDDGLTIRRRNALLGLDLRDQTTFYYLCLGILAVAVLLCWRLMNARFGMVIRGCRQNERRLKALGISTYRYKLVCFMVAAALAGLAGALMTNHARFVGPDMMHWTKSGELMVMVILGGAGTLFGPILGAIALVGLETGLAAVTEHWMIILGPILVLVILFARRGIWGLIAPQRSGP
jgi:branched-chain amino acid transport system permease protein